MEGEEVLLRDDVVETVRCHDGVGIFLHFFGGSETTGDFGASFFLEGGEEFASGSGCGVIVVVEGSPEFVDDGEAEAGEVCGVWDGSCFRCWGSLGEIEVSKSFGHSFLNQFFVSFSERVKDSVMKNTYLLLRELEPNS